MDEHLHRIPRLELFGRTLGLYRRSFLLFVCASIIGPVALFAYRLCFGGGMIALAGLHSSQTALPVVIGILLGIVIMMAGVAMSSAATVKAVASFSIGGEVSIREAYRALGEQLWRIIGIVLSVFLRAIPGGFLFILAGVLALAIAAHLGYNSRVEAGTIGYVCGGISLASAIFASIWICTRYSLAVQACVVENVGRKIALQRSRLLTAGDRGRIMMVHFAFLLLFLLTEFILGAPTLLMHGHGVAVRISVAVASLITGALTAPVATIGMSLAYYDATARSQN